jgi:hypothetical protein
MPFPGYIWMLLKNYRLYTALGLGVGEVQGADRSRWGALTDPVFRHVEQNVALSKILIPLR